MILVDSSVWVDHLRRGNSRLRHVLEADEVLCHPCVIGELACGQLKNRVEILSLLHALPQATLVDDAEALAFLERHQLMGTGLGWIDIHLLAAALLAGAVLWTFDRPLTRAATRLGAFASVQ